MWNHYIRGLLQHKEDIIVDGKTHLAYLAKNPLSVFIKKGWTGQGSACAYVWGAITCLLIGPFRWVLRCLTAKIPRPALYSRRRQLHKSMVTIRVEERYELSLIIIVLSFPLWKHLQGVPQPSSCYAVQKDNNWDTLYSRGYRLDGDADSLIVLTLCILRLIPE
jgi:hypothetical protein